MIHSIAIKTYLRTYLNQNYGIIFDPSSEEFLMIYIQNVCGKAIPMCLIPILVAGIICS